MTVMDKMKHYAGVLFMILGAVALGLTRIPALGSSNALLGTGLVLIVLGIIVHVAVIKHESRY